MSDLLQEMKDHYEITKLLARYCRGIDRLDGALASSVYAQKSWDEHGPHSAPGPDFIRGVMERMGGGSTIADMHILGQTLVNIDGDEAGAETYFIFVGHRPVEGDADVLLQLGGRYVDELKRENGSWMIANRTCVRDWSVSIPINEDWLEGVTWAQGQRSDDDPSFGALKAKHLGAFH